MTSAIINQMAWTNEKFRLSCLDNTGLKRALLKMIIVDNNTSTKSNNKKNNVNGSGGAGDNLTEFLNNRGIPNNNNMSLLKLFAYNALELSAPASPLLLQQNSSAITSGWLQLSGHPLSIEPVCNGIVRKRMSGVMDSEAIAYRGMSKDIHASKLIPKFLGVKEVNNETHIELQDLLHGFKDPSVIDIKMGFRTFSESEVSNKSLRTDLYEKMMAVDPSAPTEEEHLLKGVTKLRYMMFREQMSSSHDKGFRIEAIKMRGSTPVTNLKTIKTNEDVHQTLMHYVNNNRCITHEIIKRLYSMRTLMENSKFFQSHEIVGSSIFIVYDDERVGVWLIDFAKSRPVTEPMRIDHRKPWAPGNCEEGLLFGMDELIKTFENIHNCQVDDDIDVSS